MTQTQLQPRRGNRAAAALACVTSARVFAAQPHPLLAWPPPPATRNATPRQQQPVPSSSSLFSARDVVVRYDSFAQLVDAHRGRDVLATARATLAAMQSTPVRHDVLATLSDAVLCGVLDCLGHTSRDAVQLTSTCRRLRILGLTVCRWTRVCLVPMLLPSLPATLAAHDNNSSSNSSSSTTRALPHERALRAFFATHTRGQHVQHLALVDSHYAATHDVTTSATAADTATTAAAASVMAVATLPCASPSWLTCVLQLCTQMPTLSVLDVRGVQWPSAHHFLSDLYMIAPQLRVLKMSTSLYERWTSGWWQRHTQLRTLVVGSRREHAAATALSSSAANNAEGGAVAMGDVAVGGNNNNNGGGDGDEAAAATTRTWQLHGDVLHMLATSTPRGAWCCKLWCPLDAPSLQRLLMPSTPLHGLAELTVNMQAVREAAVVAWCAAAATAAAAAALAATPPTTTATAAGGGNNNSNSGAAVAAAAATSAAEHDGSDTAAAAATAASAGTAAEAKQRARSRRGGAGGAGGAEDADAHYPLAYLHTLTLANVQDKAAATAELLQRVRATAAPRLQHVTLCNTTRVVVVADKPRKRRAH